jgi:hypothetical protein
MIKNDSLMKMFCSFQLLAEVNEELPVHEAINRVVIK